MSYYLYIFASAFAIVIVCFLDSLLFLYFIAAAQGGPKTPKNLDGWSVEVWLAVVWGLGFLG